MSGEVSTDKTTVAESGESVESQGEPVASPLSGRHVIAVVPLLWAVDLVAFSTAGLGDDTPDPLALLGVVLGAWCVNLVILWYVVCRRRGVTVVEGFALHEPEGDQRWMRRAVGLGFGGVVLAMIVIAIFSTGDSQMARLATQPLGLLALATLGIVVPPLEELYYRGFLYPALKPLFGGWGSVVLVAIWFGSAHALQLAGDWAGLAVVCLMGALWTWLRHKTGSLLPSIICHFVYNGTLIVLAIIGHLALPNTA